MHRVRRALRRETVAPTVIDVVEIGDGVRRHREPIPAGRTIIRHNFGTRDVIVTFHDDDGIMLVDWSVSLDTVDTCSVWVGHPCTAVIVG